MRLMMLLGLLLLACAPALAQETARAARDASLQASRYELVIGKLQNQLEQLQGVVRAIQRQNDQLTKDVQASNARAQGVSDELQRIQNTQLQNLNEGQKQLAAKVAADSNRPMAWGDGQRDCRELGVKHQQLKVSVKPDGSRGVRYLCFDGKVLHLGSEVYTVDAE